MARSPKHVFSDATVRSALPLSLQPYHVAPNNLRDPWDLSSGTPDSDVPPADWRAHPEGFEDGFFEDWDGEPDSGEYDEI